MELYNRQRPASGVTRQLRQPLHIVPGTIHPDRSYPMLIPTRIPFSSLQGCTFSPGAETQTAIKYEPQTNTWLRAVDLVIVLWFPWRRPLVAPSPAPRSVRTAEPSGCHCATKVADRSDGAMSSDLPSYG